jgi:hypothetical protein
MKLRLNTGFEDATRFVILWLIRHLAVEARHCEQRFTRHFIKNLKSIPIYFDVDIFNERLVLTTPQSYTLSPTNARDWAFFNTPFFILLLLISASKNNIPARKKLTPCHKKRQTRM